MSVYIFCVGSNQGIDNVEKALIWLETKLEDMIYSSIYRTPAIQGVGDSYFNVVVKGKCDLISPEQLAMSIKLYESECGRDETSRGLNIVPIDIDIVVRDEEIIRPWDYRQNFFQIGFSELAGSVI